jgi:hypothetical protein
LTFFIFIVTAHKTLSKIKIVKTILIEFFSIFSLYLAPRKI